jgi:hypothetical protein
LIISGGGKTPARFHVAEEAMPVNPFTDPEFHSPPNTKRIEKLYVGMSEDARGFNGICGAVVPGIGGAPMVTSSENVFKFFKEQVALMGRRNEVKFFEFHRGEEIKDEESL